MNTQVNDPKGAAGALKAPMHLIPPYALEQTAWVHKLGSEKYGPYNWRKTGVCTTFSVSDNRMDIEKLRLEHDHTSELLEAQLKQPAPNK